MVGVFHVSRNVCRNFRRTLSRVEPFFGTTLSRQRTIANMSCDVLHGMSWPGYNVHPFYLQVVGDNKNATQPLFSSSVSDACTPNEPQCMGRGGETFAQCMSGARYLTCMTAVRDSRAYAKTDAICRRRSSEDAEYFYYCTVTRPSMPSTCSWSPRFPCNLVYLLRSSSPGVGRRTWGCC